MPDRDDEDLSLAEEIGVHAFAFSRLGDFESEPFRSKDDITLLSYGWKYGNSSDTMYWTSPDGVEWGVDLTLANPKFWCNGASVGSLTYDEVVSLFSHKK